MLITLLSVFNEYIGQYFRGMLIIFFQTEKKFKQYSLGMLKNGRLHCAEAVVLIIFQILFSFIACIDLETSIKLSVLTFRR